MALTKIGNNAIVASTVTQHVTPTDLTPVRQDVLTLALKQATQENSTKFNLPNSAITKFEADADYDSAGSTTISRNTNEYLEAMVAGGLTVTKVGSPTHSTTQSTSWSSSSRYAPLIIRCTPTPSMATSCRAVIIGFSSPQPYDQSTSRVC